MNISGKFKIPLFDSEKEIRCTFGAIEMLEDERLKRPVISALNDALNGKISFLDVVGVVEAGLHGNRDTRFTREEIGEEILINGMENYIPIYIEFLTYAITGDTKLKVEKATKKKPKPKSQKAN